MLEILVGPGAELRKKIIAKGIISRWIHLRMLPKTRSFVDFACRGRVRGAGCASALRGACGDSRHRTPHPRTRRRGLFGTPYLVPVKRPGGSRGTHGSRDTRAHGSHSANLTTIPPHTTNAHGLGLKLVTVLVAFCTNLSPNLYRTGTVRCARIRERL
jgi:hypothetical protein